MKQPDSKREPRQARGARLYKAALATATQDTPDFASAYALLKEAMNEGDADATYALATWYLFGKEPYLSLDYAEGARLLQIAADKGIPEAMYDLAVSFEDGLGIKQDEAKAFEYYLRAAIRGDADSVFNVGRCLFYGLGTREDQAQAQIWLERAEELGTFVVETED
jgi:hypothetical protein